MSQPKDYSKISKPPRTPWAGFPPVVAQQPLGASKNSNLYQAAKSGDFDAAFNLILPLVTEEAVESLRQQIGDRKPIVVPVVAEEASGMNQIPRMYAEILAHKLGLETSSGNIVQVVRAKHTDASAYHRIAFNPQFDGDVIPGQNYLIVDDTLGMGGTLASLRGFIEKNGGSVVCASTLTAHPAAVNFAISDKMKGKLQRKHPGVDECLKATLGYGVDCLTQGEAGHINSCPDLDAFKTRLIEAIEAAGMCVSSLSLARCIENEGLNINADRVHELERGSGQRSSPDTRPK